MSSRWYPIYSRGNPQLRIFLPNFWMKIVKNKNAKVPPNIVSFEVSPEMTRIDVKNYFGNCKSKKEGTALFIGRCAIQNIREITC